MQTFQGCRKALMQSPNLDTSRKICDTQMGLMPEYKGWAVSTARSGVNTRLDPLDR
jgi:hypothetical protein